MKYLWWILGIAVAAVAGLYFLTRKPVAASGAGTPAKALAAAPPPSYAGNKDAQMVQAAGGALGAAAAGVAKLADAFNWGGSAAPDSAGA
jgi:hypothetical protein